MTKPQSDKNISPENVRFKKVRESLNLDQNTLAKALNMKQGSISDIERGKNNVSSDVIFKLKAVYGVNPDYIAHGKQPMIIEGYVSEPAIQYNAKLIQLDSPPNLYMIPLKAQGGFLNGYSNKVYMDSLEKLSFPLVRGNCYGFEVDGFSMVSDDPKEDSYYPGSWVICTELENLSWLQKGKVYVFATIDGVIIKQFNKIEDGKCYLKSINEAPEYRVAPIPLKSIKRVFFIENIIAKPKR